MSEENTNIEETVETTPEAPVASSEEKKENMDETIAKIVEQRVTEQLQDIKGKLDSAYEIRDEAIREAAKIKEEQKAHQIGKLEEEGKHKEVYELKLADLAGKLEARDAQITELTRNTAVREAISGLDFRNDSASKMAYTEIVGDLIQDENGAWIHKSGISIKEFASLYRKDDEKSFLFKPKQSSGVNTGNPTSALQSDPSKLTKPLSEMTHEELMQSINAGAFNGADDGRIW
jgi:hypothetical protein